MGGPTVSIQRGALPQKLVDTTVVRPLSASETEDARTGFDAAFAFHPSRLPRHPRAHRCGDL